MTKFKVGDRVRPIGYEDTHWDAEGVVTEEYDGFCILARINEREGGFAPHELAPAPLQLEAGKFYRTRAGRKVGPATQWDGYAVLYPECRWVIDGVLYQDDGTFADGGYSVNDLIAEWVDEPPASEAPTAAGSTSDNASTTGFTVPLCAYEPTVTTTALGDAYVAGYKAGLAAATAQAA